jgi:glycosyltransferase involved in cell wall biosynthesis
LVIVCLPAVRQGYWNLVFGYLVYPVLLKTEKITMITSTQTKRRIAIFSWESLHALSIGLVSEQVSYSAKALAERGHEVHLFTRTDKRQKPQEVIEGVFYHRLRLGQEEEEFKAQIQEWNELLVQSFQEAESQTGAFDILHCFEWTSAGVLKELKSRLKQKAVLTLYSTEYQRLGHRFQNGMSKWIMEQEQEVIQLADCVIAAKEEIRQELKWHYNLSDEKLNLIYEGIEALFVSPEIDKAKIKHKYDLEPLDPTVLFSSPLEYEYGPDIMLHALALCRKDFPRLRFIFCGSGGMRAELERLAGEWKLSEVVRFLDTLSEKDFAELFASIDIFAICARREDNLDSSILRAFSLAKPVIITHKGPSELIWHDVNGLKIYDNPESFAWAIKRLLRDWNFTHWLGENGQISFQTVFSFPAIAANLEKIYFA